MTGSVHPLFKWDLCSDWVMTKSGMPSACQNASIYRGHVSSLFWLNLWFTKTLQDPKSWSIMYDRMVAVNLHAPQSHENKTYQNQFPHSFSFDYEILCPEVIFLLNDPILKSLIQCLMMLWNPLSMSNGLLLHLPAEKRNNYFQYLHKKSFTDKNSFAKSPNEFVLKAAIE